LQVLHSLPSFDHPDLIVGTNTSDDAGVFRLRPDLAVVNTVDFFTPIVDDPYVFGQIAAANALSDVYAMGADPRTALNIVGFPKGKLELEVLQEILRGGADKAREADVVVLGGHTIIDPEIKYGMAVTGIVHPDHVIRNVGIKAGDALVLTKALGTGIVTTAIKNRRVPSASVRAAVRSMTTLNRVASEVMRRCDVHACSDVTGFGLLGHAFEMASGSGVSVTIDWRTLPILPGARRLATQGHITGGCGRNRLFLADKTRIERTVPAAVVEVAFDPQTSGGLLIAIAEAQASSLVRALHDAGISQAVVIGHASAPADVAIYLV